jgi:LuxR family maltose regulon positive regulatory protein
VEQSDAGAVASGDRSPQTDPLVLTLQAAVAESRWEAASAAVRQGWFDLFTEHGEQTRLLLEQVPLSALRSQPLLAMALGLTYNTLGFHRVRSLRYFVMAVRAARAPRNLTLPAVDRALIRSAEAAALRLIGHPGMSVTAAKAARSALERLSDDERQQVSQIPRIYAQLGISLYYAGDVEAAMETFERGLAESPTSGFSPGFGNLAMLAGIHALGGDLPEAKAYLAYARGEPWTDRQRSMYTGTFYRLAEAVVLLERFDAEGARGHLAAMEHDRRSIEHWLACAQVEAMASLVAGEPGEALAGLETYVAMRAAEGRSASARQALARIRSVLQLALGNPDAALAIVERDAVDGPLRHLEHARALLSLGRNGSALTGLRELAGLPLTAREQAEAAAIEAAVLLRLSAGPRTQGAIQHLGGLLRRTEQRLAIALLPQSDRDRVAAALEEAGYDDIVADLPTAYLIPDAQAEQLLSDRELTVLSALMETGSITEIAARLVVSTNTVKTQVRSIYRKLGVGNREDAIAVAVARHLLVERD